MVYFICYNFFQARTEAEHLIERQNIESKSSSKNLKTSLGVLFRPEVMIPFVIINIFNILQIFSGTYIIVFYAVDILSHINNENLDHFLAAVLTACVRFLFSIIASLLLAVIGRRALAITSGLGTTISALLLGTFLYPKNTCLDYTADSYFAAICILLYVATNTMGFMILPGVMLGELFPSKFRGLAGGLTFMIFNFALFGAAKAFPFIKNMMGIHGVFWLFGSIALVATLFLYLVLPETKDKTLSQIEDYFGKGNVLWIKKRTYLKTETVL